MGGGRPTPGPVEVVPYDPDWPARYEQVAERVGAALGDRVLGLEHVGSTSVPGLAAKPVIDVDLTVADSSDEDAYLHDLEAAGFGLVVREPSWHQHRALTHADPRTNLHVFSPDCPEVVRHRLFRDWLREHPDDLALYRDAKTGAAAAVDRRRRARDGLQPAQGAGHPRHLRPSVPGARAAAVSGGPAGGAPRVPGARAAALVRLLRAGVGGRAARHRAAARAGCRTWRSARPRWVPSVPAWSPRPSTTSHPTAVARSLPAGVDAGHAGGRARRPLARRPHRRWPGCSRAPTPPRSTSSRRWPAGSPRRAVRRGVRCSPPTPRSRCRTTRTPGCGRRHAAARVPRRRPRGGARPARARRARGPGDPHRARARLRAALRGRQPRVGRRAVAGGRAGPRRPRAARCGRHAHRRRSRPARGARGGHRRRERRAVRRPRPPPRSPGSPGSARSLSGRALAAGAFPAEGVFTGSAR